MTMNTIPTIKSLKEQGKSPEILFWVGCAGAFDERYKRVTRAFIKILQASNTDFAILGKEESCTGDPAKRAGNEFLFQMQALSNIEILNFYEVKTIVTSCPHCFNTLKNEYPSLGGNYDVIHHSEFLQGLIDEGKIKINDASEFKGKKITYHDSCYLGRGNNIYSAPRRVLETLDADLVEMKSCKKKGLCCGAGGAQMFKESEKGEREINEVRSEEVVNTKAKTVASACPFCMTMLKDGLKTKDEGIKVLDLAEIIAQNIK